MIRPLCFTHRRYAIYLHRFGHKINLPSATTSHGLLLFRLVLLIHHRLGEINLTRMLYPALPWVLTIDAMFMLVNRTDEASPNSQDPCAFVYGIVEYQRLGCIWRVAR